MQIGDHASAPARAGFARRQYIGAFEARDSDVCADADVCPGLDDGFCADVDCDDADGASALGRNDPVVLARNDPLLCSSDLTPL